MGFSPRIHDRSQPPTFPRSIKIRERPASYQFLEEMVARFKYACKVIRYKDYYSALVSIEIKHMHTCILYIYINMYLGRTSSLNTVASLDTASCRALFCRVCLARASGWHTANSR